MFRKLKFHFIAEIECWNNDDRDAKGSGYKGTQSVTKGGFTCQKWTEQSPQQHGFDPGAYGDKGVGDHNYCRNPQEKHDETWCYTTSPDKRWDWCEVPSCDADTTGLHRHLSSIEAPTFILKLKLSLSWLTLNQYSNISFYQDSLGGRKNDVK